MIMRRYKFVAKVGEGAVLEEDEEYQVRCPFCRREMIKQFELLLSKSSPIFNLLLAIKFHSYLKQPDEADEYRRAYLSLAGMDSPI